MGSKTTEEIKMKGNIIGRNEVFSLDVNDFIHIFIAIHISQRNYSFNMKMLLDFIKHCKKNNKYDDLLSGVNISSIDGELYSRELELQIELLKKEKILYKNSSYDDSHIYINECLLLSKKLTKDMTQYIDRMILFTKEYSLFETKRIIRFYEDLYKRGNRESGSVNKNFIRVLVNND